MNKIAAINHYSPTIYSSTNPKSNINFFDNFAIIGRNDSNRSTDYIQLKNEFFRNIFSIKKDAMTGEIFEVNPFIYGVDYDNLYSQSQLTDINGTNLSRLLLLSRNDFVENSNKIDNIQPNKYLIKKSNIDSAKSLDSNILLANNLNQKNGTFYVEINSNKKINSRQRVCIQNYCSVFRKPNMYSNTQNDKLVYLIDSRDVVDNELVASFQNASTPNEYIEYSIYFFPSNIISKNKDISHPSNIKTEYNKKFNFEIDMKTNGYLVTSIFYDENYEIIINGEHIKNEQINGNFLGCKLTKGNSKITITLKRPDLKVGIILSLIGLFSLLIICKKERIFNNIS